MQDLPEKSLLLEAIAAFLDREVRPKIEQPSVAFRVRIAVHLAQMVAREIKSEDAHDLKELASLAELLGREVQSPPPATREARARAIEALKREVVEHIRREPLDDRRIVELSSAIRAMLADKLAVSQPKFDTRLDVE